MFILWLTGVMFIATEVALFWFAVEVRRPRESRAGEVHARQPHAGSRLDDPAGGHAAVHRHLSDERLGRRQDAASPICRSRRRSPAGSSSGTCAIPGADGELHTPDDIVRVDGDMHFPVDEEVLLDHQERGRAAQLLPAQPAGEAGRRARHGAVRVVQGRETRPRSTSSAPSCAAGATTR